MKKISYSLIAVLSVALLSSFWPLFRATAIEGKQLNTVPPKMSCTEWQKEWEEVAEQRLQKIRQQENNATLVSGREMLKDRVVCDYRTEQFKNYDGCLEKLGMQDRPFSSFELKPFQWRRNKAAVVFLAGIGDTSYTMHGLADCVTNGLGVPSYGANYTGHGPKLGKDGRDTSNLKLADWRLWRFDMLNAIQQAIDAGAEKIFLAGESTGAMISMYLSMQECLPKQVIGQIVMAPPVNRDNLYFSLKNWIPYIAPNACEEADPISYQNAKLCSAKPSNVLHYLGNRVNLSTAGILAAAKKITFAYDDQICKLLEDPTVDHRATFIDFAQWGLNKHFFQAYFEQYDKSFDYRKPNWNRIPEEAFDLRNLWMTTGTKPKVKGQIRAAAIPAGALCELKKISDLVAPDQEERKSSIQVPTLVVGGRQDNLIDMDQAVEQIHLMMRPDLRGDENFQHYIMDHAGHSDYLLKHGKAKHASQYRDLANWRHPEIAKNTCERVKEFMLDQMRRRRHRHKHPPIIRAKNHLSPAPKTNKAI